MDYALCGQGLDDTMYKVAYQAASLILKLSFLHILCHCNQSKGRDVNGGKEYRLPVHRSTSNLDVFFRLEYIAKVNYPLMSYKPMVCDQYICHLASH